MRVDDHDKCNQLTLKLKLFWLFFLVYFLIKLKITEIYKLHKVVWPT